MTAIESRIENELKYIAGTLNNGIKGRWCQEILIN
jgi:hypothetical protein